MPGIVPERGIVSAILRGELIWKLSMGTDMNDVFRIDSANLGNRHKTDSKAGDTAD